MRVQLRDLLVVSSGARIYADAVCQPDRTAVAVALWRAAHTLIDQPPHVLEDTIGLRLAQAGGLAPMELDHHWLRTQWGADAQVRPFRAAVVARARFVEDQVCAALIRGVDQYLILGAGLDSFVVRHQALRHRLEVFEVDDAGTQAWKRGRLEELGLAKPANLHFVPADFGSDVSLIESLRRTSFDPCRLALVSAMGVSQYISVAALRAMMRELASLAPGTKFVCSFIRPTDTVDVTDRESVSLLAGRAALNGHPWISCFHPRELIALARHVGFSHVRDVTARELTRLYFAGRIDGFQPTSAEHLLVATV